MATTTRRERSLQAHLCFPRREEAGRCSHVCAVESCISEWEEEAEAVAVAVAVAAAATTATAMALVVEPSC